MQIRILVAVVVAVLTTSAAAQTPEGVRPDADDVVRLHDAATLRCEFENITAVDGHRDLRQSERESVQTPVPLPCSSRSWKKKMMAVVAVRNRVCAVLQTPVGAVVGVWGAMERKVRLATAVSGVSERPELAPSDRFRYGERVASQQVDVLVAER